MMLCFFGRVSEGQTYRGSVMEKVLLCVHFPVLCELPSCGIFQGVETPGCRCAASSLLDEIGRKGPVEVAGEHAAAVLDWVNGVSVWGSGGHFRLILLVLFHVRQ